MKKLLSILGFIFILLITVIAYLAFAGIQLDKESASFANIIVPSIVTNWDMTALAQNGNSRFIETMNQSPDREKIISDYKSLGHMLSFNGCQGQAHVDVSSRGKFTSAQYVCGAAFEKAPATINLVIFKDPVKGWQIIGFKVVSSYFLRSQ